VFKCAPPIREDRHRLALWQGLIDGIISMVVSDHSPAPPDLKALDSGDFGEAWGGISSLELRLPAVWTAGQAFSVRLEDLALWLASAPADLAGLGHRKGRLAPGCDADIVVFDPNQRWTVDAADLRHRHPISAYQGIQMLGRVTETFLRGWPTADAESRPPEPMGMRLTR
jgi:allantoinase